MIGPITTALGCFSHVLVAIDKFTKWIEYKPIAKLTPDRVVDFISDILHLFDFPNTIIIVAEPPELHRLKYASPLSKAPTYFKRCNPLVCRVSAQYNHGSTGSMQVYSARRRVYNHSTTHYF
jgi:hypothetical protein